MTKAGLSHARSVAVEKRHITSPDSSSECFRNDDTTALVSAPPDKENEWMKSSILVVEVSVKVIA